MIYIYIFYFKALWLLFGKWMVVVQIYLQTDQFTGFLLIQCLGLVSLQGQDKEVEVGKKQDWP